MRRITALSLPILPSSYWQKSSANAQPYVCRRTIFRTQVLKVNVLSMTNKVQSLNSAIVCAMVNQNETTWLVWVDQIGLAIVWNDNFCSP